MVAVHNCSIIDVVETEYANATAERDYMNECPMRKERSTMKERGKRRVKGIDDLFSSLGCPTLYQCSGTLEHD